MKKYLPIILRFFLVAIVLQVGRELEIEKQLGGIITSLIYLFSIVWVFRGKRVFTYRFGQNLGESKDKKRNYTFIIGLVGIVLVGYLIVTLLNPKLTNANEIVYVESDSLYYWKKDMTLFTGIAVGYLNPNPDRVDAANRQGREYHQVDSVYIELKNGEYDGLERGWYGNGQLENEYNWKNGERDGLSRNWLKTGELYYEKNYKNGELDGLGRYWHQNGQLQSESNYKNGKEDGSYRYWHENGQLYGESNYKNGDKQDGLERGWYENGQLMYEYNYKNGERDGLARWWYENGQLWYAEIYKDGVLIERN